MLIERGTHSESPGLAFLPLQKDFYLALFDVSCNTLHITWHLTGISKFSLNELFMRIESLLYDFMKHLMDYSHWYNISFE